MPALFSSLASLPSALWRWLHSDDSNAAVARGALISLAGVGLTFATQYVTSADFGAAGPFVAMAWAIVANAARKQLGLLEARPADTPPVTKAESPS